MALLSLSMGADVASVTLLQVFRLLAAVLTTPVLCRMWMRNHPSSPVCCVAKEGDDPVDAVGAPVPSGARMRTNVLCFAAAVFGGAAGKWLSLPAGPLIGAMIGSGSVTLLIGEPKLPVGLIRTFGQVGVGIIIARSITKAVLLGFVSLLGPLALLTVGMIGGSLLLAVLLHRTRDDRALPAWRVRLNGAGFSLELPADHRLLQELRLLCRGVSIAEDHHVVQLRGRAVVHDGRHGLRGERQREADDCGCECRVDAVHRGLLSAVSASTFG